MSEFTSGSFTEVIDDATVKAKDVKRIIFCSGKIFYDLQEVQQRKKIKDAAVVRIEQLYPFPDKQVNKLIKKYKDAKLLWIQEEPKNMGYWSFIKRMLPDVEIQLGARKSSASPATGYSKVHKMEQEKIVNKAFEI